ncbi:hypothetical protein [Chryseobacterium sp. BGARF1]|nr:hypothetical protein [Chryseobacterium sp. BGARF1]
MLKTADYICTEEQYSKLILTEHIQKYQSEYYVNIEAVYSYFGF